MPKSFLDTPAARAARQEQDISRRVSRFERALLAVIAAREADHEGPITVHEHLLAVQIAEAVDTYEQSLRVPPPELPAVESNPPAAPVRRRRRRRAAGAAKPPGRPRKALAPPAG